MRNKSLIRELKESLHQSRHSLFFPNLDFEIPPGGLTESTMKKLQRDHFSAIQKADLVYVLNPDGYIGRMVGIETGYAKALGKRLIFMSKTGHLELDVLADAFLDRDRLFSYLEDFS